MYQVLQVPPSDPRLDEAVAVMVASFGDNQTTSRHLPDPGRRHRYMRHLSTAGVRDVARYGRVWVAERSAAGAGRGIGADPPDPTVGGRQRPGSAAADAAVGGVLLALPPGGFPASLRRRLRMLPRIGRAASVARRAYPALRRAAVDLRGTLPSTQDWWYMHTVAVHPEVRRGGVGSMLVRHALRAGDETGSPAYLHTQGLGLARRWQRFGFVTVGTQCGHGSDEPPYHTMHRPSARAEAHDG